MTTIPQDTSLPDADLDAIEAAAIAVRDQPLGKAYCKSMDDYQMSGVERTLCDIMDHETTLRMVAEIRRLRAALSFYADARFSDLDDDLVTDDDGTHPGAKARAALKENGHG